MSPRNRMLAGVSAPRSPSPTPGAMSPEPLITKALAGAVVAAGAERRVEARRAVPMLWPRQTSAPG